MTYRSSGEPKDIAIDPEEVLAAQRRTRKKRLVALGAAVVIVGGAATAGAFAMRAKTHSEEEHAWNVVATCLVGGPLAPGEKASVRVRNEQLAAMGASLAERAAWHDGGFPMQCATRAHALAETLKSDGDGNALAASSEKLAKAIGNANALTADLSALVDAAFADAAHMGLATTKVAESPLPPDPVAPQSLATLPKSARVLGDQSKALNLASVYGMPFGDTTLHLLLDDKDLTTGPVLCAFSGGSELACKKVPKPAAELSPGLRLWGTTAEGATPYVFAGDRGRTGIFRGDTGARVVEKLEYGAYGATSLKDGSLAYLVWNEKKEQTDLVVSGEFGAPKVSPVVSRKESGNPYYSTGAFWDFVAYKSVQEGVDGIRLMVRPIEADHSLGAPIDVGRIDEVGEIEGGSDEDPHLTACRTKDAIALRAKGWHNTYVSFRVAGKWTAPVEAKGLGGKLQCRPGEATITHIYTDGEVRLKSSIGQSRCTVSDCEERDVEFGKLVGDVADKLPRSASDIRAVDLGGKLLVVWVAGERGGVRMRLAPFNEIALAKDTVLFDDHLRDGAYRTESTVVELQLVPAPGGALLLLGTVDGMYAELIDEKGALHPVATKL